MRQTGSKRSMVAHMYGKTDHAGRLDRITPDMVDNDPWSDHWKNVADKRREMLINLVGFEQYTAYVLSVFPDNTNPKQEAELLRQGLITGAKIAEKQ